MKKNRLFVLGLVTVFVALVSLTLVSGTLAKYTTTASGSDDARVAYWGFEQTSYNLTGLFVNEYDAVKADDKVIAPGTKKEIPLAFKSNLSAAPEVDYSLEYTLTITGNDDLIKALNDCDGFQWLFNGTAYDKVADVVAAFDDELDKARVGAGIVTNDEFTFGWQWAYTGNDVEDTELGNRAMEFQFLTVTITTVATQLDN